MTDLKKDEALRADILALLRQRFSSEFDTSAKADREEFLYRFGRLRDVATYSILFAPRFIVVEGCVFLAELGARPRSGWDAFANDIRKARMQGVSALEALLAGYNWFEVPYAFTDNSATDVDDELVARIVADAWRARLAFLFPTHRFNVRVIPPQETGGSVGVGFTQQWQT